MRKIIFIFVVVCWFVFPIACSIKNSDLSFFGMSKKKLEEHDRKLIRSLGKDPNSVSCTKVEDSAVISEEIVSEEVPEEVPSGLSNQLPERWQINLADVVSEIPADTKCLVVKKHETPRQIFNRGQKEGVIPHGWSYLIFMKYCKNKKYLHFCFPCPCEYFYAGAEVCFPSAEPATTEW